MRRQITERIIAGLLVVFLLTYVGYQARRYLYKPVTTETVYEYTVSRAISTQGIAARQETMLDQNASGIEYYPLEDASRVAVGETVAEIYRGGRTGDTTTKRARAAEEEILRLVEAQNTVVDYSNTEIYNKDIKTKLSELTAMSSNGSFYDLGDIRDNLTLTINKKQISYGKAEDFSLRIQQLERELEGMEKTIRTDVGTVVNAPAAGYFSRSVDGMEAAITPQDLKEMTVTECLELIGQQEVGRAPSKVGKMVNNQNWVFAAGVPSYNNEWIKVGQSVQLQFEHVARSVPATVSKIIEERGNDTAILIFDCSIMNEDVINLRRSNVAIHFQKYTGIRINSSDLRFVPDDEGVMQRGVYVLDDQVVRFKKIDPIYEEQGFVLSKSYYVDSLEKGYVRLFDQVITKYKVGMDIQDGKPIQDYY